MSKIEAFKITTLTLVLSLVASKYVYGYLI